MYERGRPGVAYSFIAPAVSLKPRVWDFVKGMVLASVVFGVAFVMLAFGAIRAYLDGDLNDLELSNALVEPTVWALFVMVAFELLWVCMVVMQRGSGDFGLDIGLTFHQSDVLLGFGAWLVDAAGAAVLYGVLVPLMTEDGLSPEPFDPLARYVTISPSLKIVLLVTIGLMVPLAEEMLFRGILLGAIQRWLGPIAAIILSAIVFGLFHAGSWTARDLAFVVWAIWAGLVFGVLRVGTNRLGAPIIAHGIHNTLIVALAVFSA